jgi:hypothetical protein
MIAFRTKWGISVTTPEWVGTFFGDPWPSGICDEGTQVETPLGVLCLLCREPIQVFDQGSFMASALGLHDAGPQPVHRECSLRSVLGGIGHHISHDYWCSEMKDPDAGGSYRQSALLVWDLVKDHGIPSE